MVLETTCTVHSLQGALHSSLNQNNFNRKAKLSYRSTEKNMALEHQFCFTDNYWSKVKSSSLRGVVKFYAN